MHRLFPTTPGITTALGPDLLSKLLIKHLVRAVWVGVFMKGGNPTSASPKAS